MGLKRFQPCELSLISMAVRIWSVVAGQRTHPGREQRERGRGLTLEMHAFDTFTATPYDRTAGGLVFFALLDFWLQGSGSLVGFARRRVAPDSRYMQ